MAFGGCPPTGGRVRGILYPPGDPSPDFMAPLPYSSKQAAIGNALGIALDLTLYA